MITCCIHRSMNFVIYREVLTLLPSLAFFCYFSWDLYLRQSNSFHRRFAQWNCASHCYAYNNATSRRYSFKASTSIKSLFHLSLGYGPRLTGTKVACRSLAVACRSDVRMTSRRQVIDVRRPSGRGWVVTWQTGALAGRYHWHARPACHSR